MAVRMRSCLSPAAKVMITDVCPYGLFHCSQTLSALMSSTMHPGDSRRSFPSSETTICLPCSANSVSTVRKPAFAAYISMDDTWHIYAAAPARASINIPTQKLNSANANQHIRVTRGAPTMQKPREPRGVQGGFLTLLFVILHCYQP